MSYFIFNKSEGFGSLYKIQENLSDMNYVNIQKSDYKIIEDTQENFNFVKYGLKDAACQNNNLILTDSPVQIFKNKEYLQQNISILTSQINQFLEWNSNHPLYSRWNSYKNQINNLDLNSITYPLNKSLAKYFNDLGQPSYNILQLP